MHYTEKKKKGRPTDLRKLCKLSEFGKCDIQFDPKRPWQEFCCIDHQKRYWILARTEKRYVLNKLPELERRVEAIEKRLGMK